MRRQDRGRPVRRRQRFGEPLRIVRKACDRVGIEHHRALALQRRQHEFARRLTDADARPDRERIEPTVGEERAQLGRTVDRPHHHGQT